MRVLTYEAHNVGRLSEVKFDLTGRHLYIIGGKNSAGKTSALNALKMALCGRSGMGDDYPEISLREGEDEGWVKVELDAPKLTVELYLKRRRDGQVVEKLKVAGENGDLPSPRAVLQQLYSLKAFDPLAFERMDKKSKRKMLLELVGVDLTSLEQEYKRLFDERAAVNKEGKRLAALVETMPQHDGVPDLEVSLSDLVCRRDRRQAHNQRNEKERQRLSERKHNEDAARANVARIEAELLALERELESAKNALDQAEVLTDTQQKTVDALEDQDVAEVTRQMETAEDTNRKVRENKARAAAVASLATARAEWKKLDADMQAIKDSQVSALENAKWPVEGLGFDEDGVLFNGLPFEQASKSQRVLISTRIGMALNPELKLLVCEDGSDLDEDTLQSLDKALEENGFQMILELVTRGGDDDLCAVVIEDGKARGTGRQGGESQ